MKFGEINKVILFGGSLTTVNLCRWLLGQGIQVRVYTSFRHAKEPLDQEGRTLEQQLREISVPFVITADINGEVTLLEEITPKTLGIGIGEAWSFKAELIEAFDGRLLDFMGIPLPRYRGGAHYTWMILRGDRKSGCNLQVINTEMIQGVFDSGEIVFSDSFEFEAGARIPQDYFNQEAVQAVEFLKRFLQEIRNGRTFKMRKLDEKKSLYLPRVNTIQHGWIDWGWDGKQIERFIRAFDTPYAGASTRIRGQRVRLKDVRLDKREAPFHPFQSGLITRISPEEGVVIATTSGHLWVRKVIDEAGNCINKNLQTGTRFFSSPEDIRKAYEFEAVYNADGPSGERKFHINDGEIIKGNRISLRLVTLEDCTPGYVDWLNDSKVNRYLETRWKIQTLNSVKEFVRDIRENEGSLLFAIIEGADKRHIGNIKIGPVNPYHNYADLSYFIGDRSCWGKGFATEAVILATRFGFERMKLNRCQAGIYSGNIGSKNVLEKAEYKLEGILRSQMKGPSGWEDHLLYGVLKSEFK